MLKDEVLEGSPKADVVPEHIDAVLERIMQDRHVTYREIESSLGLSFSSIPGRRKDLLSLHSAQIDNRSKKVSCRLV